MNLQGVSHKTLIISSHDNTWRLFDIEQNEEVLYQEGHTRAVYDVDFQADGALAATGCVYCVLWTFMQIYVKFSAVWTVTVESGTCARDDVSCSWRVIVRCV